MKQIFSSIILLFLTTTIFSNEPIITIKSNNLKIVNETKIQFIEIADEVILNSLDKTYFNSSFCCTTQDNVKVCTSRGCFLCSDSRSDAGCRRKLARIMAEIEVSPDGCLCN